MAPGRNISFSAVDVLCFLRVQRVPRVGKCNTHEMLHQKCFHLFKSGPILENVEIVCDT